MASVDGHDIWSNKSIVLDRIGYEKESRSWRNEHDTAPTTKSWRSWIEGAMEDQAARGEVDDFEIDDVQPCRMCLGDGEMHYMDHSGELWDEVSHKKLDDAGVRNARLEAIEQFYAHGVYEKLPTEKSWSATGNKRIQAKCIDIDRGDEVHGEYGSRLVAKEIKLDKRNHLFAATPPLEAKKMLLSYPMTAGIGYLPGEEGGMKLNFIDISRAYFQADAIRDVYVELPSEDWGEGMCGKLRRPMHGRRDAAQNWVCEKEIFSQCVLAS